MEKIRSFIKRTRVFTALSLVGKAWVRSVPVFLAAYLFFTCLLAITELPTWVPNLIPFLLYAIPAGFFVFTFVRNDHFSLSALSKRIGSAAGLREDDVVIADQFIEEGKKTGLSTDLKNVFLHDVFAKIQSCSPLSCLPPWRWKRDAGFAMLSLLIFALLTVAFPKIFSPNSRLLVPFSTSEFDSLVQIMPGDAEVSWGEDVSISATLLAGGLEEPEMKIRTREGWVTIPIEERAQNKFVYIIKNVTQVVSYRFNWKKQNSRTYDLTPVKPLWIESFLVSIKPPRLLNKAQIEQTSPDIRGLLGSSITLKIVTTRILKNAVLLLPGEKSVRTTMLKEKEAAFNFTLESAGEYKFNLMDESGQVTMSAAYPLFIQANQPPKIALLSPTEDLLASLQDKFPLSFEASDDFGIAHIGLEWEGTKKGSKVLATYSPTKESILSGWDWDFRVAGFAVGEVLRYRLKASDGIAESVTGWRVVEITSFAESHVAMEKILEQWRDQAVDLLADVTTQEAKTKGENPDLQKATEEFNKIAAKSANLEQNLGKIVSLMEKDPYSDYGLWLEHKKMAENLATMNRDTVKQTQSALQTKNASQAAKGMEQMAAELERMTALSENLTKEQKARDLVDSSHKLEDISQSLQEKLEKAGESGRNTFDAEIQNLINEAMKSLQEMAQLMQSGSKELPEDFVNQQALKDLNMQDSADILSQISDAMKKGDRKKALELAKQFMEMAQKMRSQMSKAMDSFEEGQSSDGLSNQLEKQQKALEDAVKEQRELLAKTQTLESKRFQSVVNEQKKHLKELQARQSRVLTEHQQMLSMPGLVSPTREALGGLLIPMMQVNEELKQERVANSPTWLSGISVQLSIAESQLSTATASAVIEKVRWIKNEEEEILKELKKDVAPPSAFSQEDQQELKSLSEKQAALTAKVAPIKKELDALSRKTALLGSAATQPLSKAMNKMNDASGQLKGMQTKPAQSSEEEALSLLSQSQQALQEAQESLGKMQAMGGQAGGQGAGMAIVRSQGSQGSNPLNRVRMPRVQDFKPPKAFREELLESLREKYPKAYEEIIHDYYKKLAQ